MPAELHATNAQEQATLRPRPIPSYPLRAAWAAPAAPRRLAIGAALTLALAACAPKPPAMEPAIVEAGDWHAAFDAAGVNGVFALRRADDATTRVSDSARAARRYLPASTFKVPNSLIALELGIVRDGSAPFPMTWPTSEITSWNRDHTFASALEFSVVPVYQMIAREVGAARYRDWLDRLDYGNRDAGGDVDSFWLDGSLRTSALEQIDFLSRLVNGELPVSARSLDIVRQMMVQEATDCYAVHGKTGLVGVAVERQLGAGERVGWYVGWVETDTAAWVFALNIDNRGPEDVARRVPLARALLQQAGALPAGGCPADG